MFQLVMNLTIKSDRAASDCLAASLGLTLLLRDASAGGALSRRGVRSGRVFQAVSMSWKHQNAGPNELEK
jgi:hypothetical protein